jgi:hypothetical protein
MVTLVDGDAFSSIGVAFAFPVSFLSESMNDLPVQ